MTQPATLGNRWPDPPPSLPARLYHTFTDDAGNVYSFVRVNLYQPHSTLPLAVRAYKDIGLSTPLERDSVWAPGILEVWFPTAVRVRLEWTPLGGSAIFIEDVDVHPDPATIVRSASPLAFEAADPADFVNGHILVATDPGGGTFIPPPLNPMTMEQYTDLDERVAAVETIISLRTLPSA